MRIDKTTLRSALPLLAVVLGFTVLTLVISELLGGPEKLAEAVRNAGAWAPVLYVLVKASTYIIAPLSGASIEMAAGALFGILGGTLLSVLGSTIGGAVNYWIARTLGRQGVLRFAGKKGLVKVDETADRVGGWRALLAARIVLAPIYDFVSYAAGLAQLPFQQYVLVSIIGGLPVTFIFPLLGHASAQSKVVLYALLGVSAICLLVYGLVLIRSRDKR